MDESYREGTQPESNIKIKTTVRINREACCASLVTIRRAPLCYLRHETERKKTTSDSIRPEQFKDIRQGVDVSRTLDTLYGSQTRSIRHCIFIIIILGPLEDGTEEKKKKTAIG